MKHIFKDINVPINDIIFSTEVIEKNTDSILLKESSIDDTEFYELLIETIIYVKNTGDSVENYMYHWVFNDNVKNRWRVGIPNYALNEIAKKIKIIIKLLKIENPNLIEHITVERTDFNLSLYNKFAVLRF